MGKKKQMTVTALIALVIIMSVVFAAVYSNKSVKNNFVPAQVNVSVIENDKEVGSENELPFENGNVEKKVQIKNPGTATNAADEYVRVCIFPKFVNSSNEDMEIYIPYIIPKVITGNVFTIGDVIFTLDTDWKKSWEYINGYFYYKDILSPDDITPPLIAGVSMDADRLSYYSNKGALLRVSVLADAIQTVGGAVEARWTDSGLVSNDAVRPKEVASAAYNAFIVPDVVVTPEVAVVTEYQLQQARNMISRIFITDYALNDSEEEVIEDLDDNFDSDESDAVQEYGETSAEEGAGDVETSGE